ncbi:tRNA-dihydrouridine synthase family protein [Candidatus Wolfebacteria bacterium]|nr:tRNA-dihydrouridine synthase family protein [Candidatus Wolfebacteria bacterium]
MNRGFWDTLSKPFFCLAPMADVTDAAFRRIIARYGKPDVMWTEFISADGLFKGGYDVLVKDLQYDESERPIVAQFFSREPELMVRAAALAEKLGFDGVDINMGCPDRSVCKQGAGAAMIRAPKLAQEIIRATKEATRLPVSIKTRIGYDENELDTWLPTLLETEPAAVALHARTKKEMSKVPAHWEEIARAVQMRDTLGSATVIIGNGDIEDMADARRRAEETGADGIMLGRAIFGNPWLFSNSRELENSRSVGVVEERPPLAERLRVLGEHLTLFQELLPHKSFHLMKKHFKSYLKGDGYNKAFLLRLMGADSIGQAQKAIAELAKKGE